MEDYGLKRVVDVEYLHDYVMRLEFNNGEVRLVDFDPLLHGKFYDELRDKRNFVQFGLTSWTLEWYNGVDFAPEFLYEHSVPAYSMREDVSHQVAEDKMSYNE